MRVRVNPDLCTGCGMCVDTCSAGAIYLVNSRAEIDKTLCTACEACVEACPNGAIHASVMQQPGVLLAPMPAAKSQPMPAPIQVTSPQTITPARGSGLASLAGAALAFLGREVMPRLADVLVNVLERRFTRSTTTSISPVSAYSKGSGIKSRGKQRQARYRGGCAGARNHRGRR